MAERFSGGEFDVDALRRERWDDVARVVGVLVPDPVEARPVIYEAFVAFAAQAPEVDQAEWDVLLIRHARAAAWRHYLGQADWRPGEAYLHAVGYRVLDKERGAWELADDLVQDVLVDLMGGTGMPESRDKLKAWLATKVRHAALDLIRSIHGVGCQKRYHETLDPEVHFWVADDRTPEPGVLTEEELRNQALWSAVEALPPKLRDAVVLRYFATPAILTYDEVAGSLGISADGVKKRLGQAKTLLREALGEWRDDGDWGQLVPT